VLVVLGELINVSFGVVGSTLKMMGYDKKIRNISVVSSVIAFISSYFFIESFGIIGMGFSYILKNLIYNLWGSIVLYRKNKIHILDINYLKTLFLYAIIFVACYFFFVFKNLSTLDLVLIVGAFYIGYLFLWYIVLGKKEVPQLIELLQNDK
jgi:O-antigen/teichoic acid export membrane protein